MKKIKAILLSAVFCLSLSACEEKTNFDEAAAFENMKTGISENIESEDYYIQISRTQSEAHVMTEVSKYGDDCAFLEYDVMGALKFFRNGKLTNISADTFYQADSKDASWEDFSYYKTADTYRNALKTVIADSSAVDEITYEENDSEDFPYKVTVKYNLDKIDVNTLFGSGGNFGFVNIKFLSDESGTSFDEETLHVQYDYNSEIYVISAKYGDIDLPDEKGKNGQRPEDIEKEYNSNAEELQASFEQYLQNIQASYNSVQ